MTSNFYRFGETEAITHNHPVGSFCCHAMPHMHHVQMHMRACLRAWPYRVALRFSMSVLHRSSLTPVRGLVRARACVGIVCVHRYTTACR